MNLSITIKKTMMDNIYNHCKNEYPYECCGILIGDYDSMSVKKVIMTKNANKKPDWFEIHPDDYQKAYDIADKESMDIIGFYHSHPDHVAEPSKRDKQRIIEIGIIYGMIFMIISVNKNGNVNPKSWVLYDSHEPFHEQKIKYI